MGDYPKGRIGERLLTAGHITNEQLDQALQRKREYGGFLGDLLVEMGFVPAHVVGKLLADELNAPYVSLAEVRPEPRALKAIDEAYQRRYHVLPYELSDGQLRVAMSDPLNVVVLDDLQLMTGYTIVPALALSCEIQRAFERLHNVQAATESMLANIVTSDVEEPEPDLTIDQLTGMAGDAPVVKLVNRIIVGAIGVGASDIHIEPQEKDVQVRYRIDGVLYEQMTFPLRHQAALASRIKIMARLDIAERRRPQDGRITLRSRSIDYDLRVSTLLTRCGESIVLRLLPKSGLAVHPDDLGFLPEQRMLWEKMLRLPHGLVLVTGPTGSGKSTTLYAALRKLNDSRRKIITIEDPIEYALPGANQSQVHPQIGVTFASGLRTLVRHDPDILMVGEIRDTETAEIAVQAALTGHLVLSTLHTNDAPGALVRLQNMGVEPFLISSAVIGVIGQRLLRRVCPSCVEPDSPEPGLLQALGVTSKDLEGKKLVRGHGCMECGGRGMRGRTAAYEVMPMTEALRDGVLQRCSGEEMGRRAVSGGTLTMQAAGVHKALRGETTLAEVGRVLFGEEWAEPQWFSTEYGGGLALAA